MAIVILAFETVFNPTLLIVVINGLSGTFSIFSFIPIFWGAVAVQANVAKQADIRRRKAAGRSSH